MTDHKPLYHTVLSLQHLHDNLEPMLKGTGIRLLMNRQLDTGPKPQLMYTTLDFRVYDDVTLEELRALRHALNAVITAEETRLVDQGITTWRKDIEGRG